jgi:hypothetical protein
MMDALPDLHTLSDDELKMLPTQLMDMTLKALNGFADEIGAGNLTLEEANAKGDEVMRWSTAQQELIYAEQMRRAQKKGRKSMIIKMVLLVVVGGIAISVPLLKMLKLIDV